MQPAPVTSFREMLYHAGTSHVYKGLNAYRFIGAAYDTDTIPIETVYKELCAGTDKYSFFGVVTDPKVIPPTGRYKPGPYIALAGGIRTTRTNTRA